MYVGVHACVHSCEHVCSGGGQEGYCAFRLGFSVVGVWTAKDSGNCL